MQKGWVEYCKCYYTFRMANLMSFDGTSFVDLGQLFTPNVNQIYYAKKNIGRF